jgi:hypothetical protein
MRRYRLDSVSGWYAHAIQWPFFREILALLAVALPEARDALRSSYCLGRLFHFVKFCALTDTRDWHVENLAQIFRIGNRVEFTQAPLFLFGPEGFHAGYFHVSSVQTIPVCPCLAMSIPRFLNFTPPDFDLFASFAARKRCDSHPSSPSQYALLRRVAAADRACGEVVPEGRQRRLLVTL